MTLTEAPLARGSLVAPFQIKSSPRLPRILLIDCSPSTKRKASAILDLPEPFGPTTADIDELNSKVFFLAKDLNPKSSIDFKCILLVVSIVELLPTFGIKRRSGSFLLRVLLRLTFSLTIRFLTDRNFNSEVFIVVGS